MMKKIILLVGMGCILFPAMPAAYAQERESFEQYRNRKQAEFHHYKEERRKAFEEFRRKRNEEFAQFLRKDWRPIDSNPVIPKPKDDIMPPVVTPWDETEPVVPPVPKPQPYDEVVPVPKAIPQPEPVEPIEEILKPAPIKTEMPVQTFSFYGTQGKVRIDRTKLIQLHSLNENAIADAWLELSEEAYTNLIYDCLQIRKEHNLCDWAYLMMLKQMAEAVYGRGCNEAELLMAYVYCQSGYNMRLAIANGRLYMMFASKHLIYDWGYYNVKGEKYYALDKTDDEVIICEQEYPKEQSMSLLIFKEQGFTVSETSSSVYQSKRDADMKVTVRANRNLLDFYASYPASMIGDNLVSQWAMYANTPMSAHIRQQVYPSIEAAIRGCSQWTAVNKILNFVQTGFVYGYDDEIWGHDRAFFPEESLHYPYCDCEDRSILLTRIIRDLLGLKCILIYYPGHLASAVEFTEGNPTGDYIEYRGHRFFIADGTITGYGAPVGRTMSGMDNKAAKVILLE